MGYLEREYMHDFIRFEMLRKEYLNQTFNFMPNVQEEYDKVTRDLFYDKAQVLITEKLDYDREGLSKYYFCLHDLKFPRLSGWQGKSTTYRRSQYYRSTLVSKYVVKLFCDSNYPSFGKMLQDTSKSFIQMISKKFS